MTENNICNICSRYIYENDIIITDCGHVFCKKCLILYASSINNTCPTCGEEIKIKLKIRVCNRPSDNFETYVEGLSVEKILEIAKEKFPYLKNGSNEIISFGIANNITPQFINNEFSLYVTVINSTIQSRIKDCSTIPGLPHPMFEEYKKKYSKNYCDISKCKVCKFIIQKHQRRNFDGNYDVVQEKAYKIWIINKNDNGYWVQFETPICIGNICRCGPTLPTRYYYISKDGKLYSLCSEQQLLEISPILDPQPGSFEYTGIKIDIDIDNSMFTIPLKMRTILGRSR